MYCMCFDDPLTFLSCPLLFDWVGVLWPQLFKVLKVVRCALIWVLEHVGNFGVRLPPWRQCTLFVCSNFKLLCHKMTSASKMYTANPG